jgi:sortase (surface protein transpeptidase)
MRIAHALTGVLVLSGATCIGVAVTHQRHPQEPPLSAVASFAPPARLPPSAGRQLPTAATVPRVLGPVLPASEPLAIAIPAIGLRSPVLRLGQAADGSLEVPAPGPHYDEAGWYRYSPTPGSLGPAVIAGHVDSEAAGPSVFFRLGSLRPRDTVLITRADGSVAVFAVDAVRRYPKSRFPSQLVYGDTNRAALRLITCGGPFDRGSGHYLDNIIVLASLVRAGGGGLPRTGSPAG